MASTNRGASGGRLAGAPARLLLGSIHCHSTLSDGTGTPEEIMAKAAAVGLDYLAITDHVPAVMADLPGRGDARLPRRASGGAGPGPTGLAEAAATPLSRFGVLRVPGLEFSPSRNHYLVLGLDPWEVADPSALPGWPRPSSYLPLARSRPGLLGFLAHPDDNGNSFLKLESYRWDDWEVTDFTGLEVWNLSTDWSRHIRSYRDVLRAGVAGIYRAVPPPNPVTLARWDTLAQRRKVVGIAGTDAHAHPASWHGLRVTVFPYDRAFGTLQTAVWVEREATEGPAWARIRGILDALGEGRAFMVNRAWGYPSGFVFQARLTESAEPPFVSGDTVPAGRQVRFEVAVPWAAWLRLIRNGRVVANTYGRELTFEPLDENADQSGAGAGERTPAGRCATGVPWPGLGPPVQEAWRVEVWVNASQWNRSGSGFFLWILSNFIYRAAKG